MGNTRVVSLFVPKGGVGKTTLTAHLAAGLAVAGRRVLAVDLDVHQTQLCLYFDVERRGDTRDLFTGTRPLPDLIQTPTRFPLLHLVTGTPASSNEITNTLSRGKNPYWVTTLKQRLQPYLRHYDYVLFDPGPSITDVVQCALHASTEMWLPYRVDWMTMDSYLLLEDEVLKPMGLQPDSYITTVIPTFFAAGPQRRGPSGESPVTYAWIHSARTNEARTILETLSQKFGDRLAPPVRQMDARMQEAVSAGKTVWETAPSAPISNDLAAVVEFILNREVP